VCRQQTRRPAEHTGQTEQDQAHGDDPVVDTAGGEAPPSGSWRVDRRHHCHRRVHIGSGDLEVAQHLHVLVFQVVAVEDVPAPVAVEGTNRVA
jgi:hypothetical protein